MVKIKFNNTKIIALSIILAAFIISVSIYFIPFSSLDHCYKKNYKQRLKRELQRVTPNTFYTKEYAEAQAARTARKRCLK